MENVVIRGGRIIDGSGSRSYQADIYIKNGMIADISEHIDAEDSRILEASGCVVAPGFIDSHAHSDTSFLSDDSCASKLSQGITTEITGQCGSSPFPAKATGDGKWESYNAFLRCFDANHHKMAVNQAILVGHGTLRAAVMGYEDRKPSLAELSQMKALLERELSMGAWGMSLGLEYSPGFFAGADELSELSEIVRRYDGLVPCHMRNEGLKIDDAIDELVGIGQRSGARVHISHLKIDHFRAHGRVAQVWERIERAKRSGVRISADLYPFTASCTDLTIRCPKWSQEGGSKNVVKHLKGQRREEIVSHIRGHYFNRERAETCLINDDAGLWPEIVGKTLREIAEDLLNTTDYAEAAAEILIRTGGQAGGIFFVMDEGDMLYFLSQDVGIGSDGWALSGDPKRVKGKPHPRSYAAITEFFRLARERKICSLEAAVHRVTMKPAEMIGLTDRGLIRTGNAADITVFDPNTIAPESTYLEPVRLSKGIRHVLVNGEVALYEGVQTDVRSGRFLKKSFCRS